MNNLRYLNDGQIQASGNASLLFCKATPDPDSPNFLTAWGQRLWRSDHNQYHQITVGVAEQRIQIWSGQIAEVDGIQQWATRIFVGSDMAMEWRNEAIPDTVNISYNLTLNYERWIHETTGANIRPAWTGDLGASYHAKPKNSFPIDLNVQWSGGAKSYRLSAYNSLMYDFATGYLLNTAWECGASTGFLNYANIAGSLITVENKSLPFPCVFARASTLSITATDGFYGEDGSGFDTDSAHLSSQNSFSFHADTPSDGGHSIRSISKRLIAVTGRIKSVINNTLSDVPVKFGNGPTQKFSGGPFTVKNPGIGNLELTGPSDVHGEWQGANGYDSTDYACVIASTDAQQSGLFLFHLATVRAEDFISSYAPAYDWSLINCTRAIISGKLVCTPTGAGPKISRTLKNDLNEIDAYSSPSAWIADHRAGLSAEVRSFFDGEAEGPTETKRGPGLWPYIGTRLLADSDVWNYSCYRYAYLKASADSACTLHLKIDYDETTFNPHPDNPDEVYTGYGVPYTQDDVAPSRTNRVVTYDIPITTFAAEHEIDLAAPLLIAATHTGTIEQRVAHWGLRCINSVEYSWDDGVTLTLEYLDLREKLQPKVSVLQPGNATQGTKDYSKIGATVDGKIGLFVSHGSWGMDGHYSFIQDNEFFHSSALLSEMKMRIELQEGWLCSVYAPGAMAVHLVESQLTKPPYLFNVQTAYGSIYPQNPDSQVSFNLFASLGARAQVLVFDPSTGVKAEGTTVLADTIVSGTPTATLDDYKALPVITWDSDRTNSDGFAELQVVPPQFEIRTNPSDPPNEEIAYPPILVGITGYIENYISAYPRTWVGISISGPNEGTVTSGIRVSLTQDIDYNVFAALVKDGHIHIYRRLRSNTDFTDVPTVLAGDHPSICFDVSGVDGRLYLAYDKGGTVYVASNEQAGYGVWTVNEVGPGSNGYLEIDTFAGIAYLTYWNGGNSYFSVSRNLVVAGVDSAVWAAETVIAACPEQQVPFKRFPDNTFFATYTDGSGNLQTLSSTDNGVTWS